MVHYLRPKCWTSSFSSQWCSPLEESSQTFTETLKTLRPCSSWQVGHWGRQRWARAETMVVWWLNVHVHHQIKARWDDGQTKIRFTAKRKTTTSVDISTNGAYKHTTQHKKTCSESFLAQTLSVPPSLPGSRCRRTQQLLASECSSAMVVLSRDRWKAQLKLSKPHLTASQTNLNLWRAAQQHQHTTNNLVEPARAWGSVVDGEEKGGTERLHVQTLAVNVVFLLFFFFFGGRLLSV